ncbi:MAG TPA: efflux RND transporter periplasmic adaptor subunit [Thermoanaerobaculia bacterium]|nr:efflux RND transporter periplasmic adaptor subunit [Thermoanaerobaculia bacterium]
MRNDSVENRTGRGWVRWLLAIVALAVGLVVVLALARPRGAVVQTAAVRKGHIMVPVRTDGSLEPPPGGELRAEESATVGRIVAAEGARVRRGDLLLVLESPDLSRKALDARADALSLEAELESARAEAAEAERQEKHLREISESDARLLAGGAITKAAAEGDERAWRAAQDKLRAARARAGGLEGSNSRLALSQRAADELERRVAALSVHAPVDGVVYGLPRRAGETVAAGDVVANVIDLLRRRVRARVDQPDLPRIAVGQRLEVTFDGLPQDRWSGRVVSVAPGVRSEAGREVGDVIGEIADAQGRLPTNAAVEVEIVSGEKPDALVVPRAALLRDGDRRFVYVYEDGRAKRRDVSIGLLGLSDAEVASGLRENERVILPGSVTLSDGLRVRPARA